MTAAAAGDLLWAPEEQRAPVAGIASSWQQPSQDDFEEQDDHCALYMGTEATITLLEVLLVV